MWWSVQDDPGLQGEGREDAQIGWHQMERGKRTDVRNNVVSDIITINGLYSTRTLKRIIWEIGCVCTILMLESIPHMRRPLISHTIGLCFPFFDLTLFGGIIKSWHGATSRWAILSIICFS